MVSIEELYKNFGVLADAKDKAGEHEKEYLSFIEAVKGGPGEKRLASQFITRFFKYFPDCAAKAINALFDLCEDTDGNIRKQAIKDLPNVCKVQPEQVTKIAGALTQLLACEDQGEISMVQSSLVSLFSINTKGTLKGLFDQIVADHDEDDALRDRALKFLATKIKNLPEETLDKEAEEYILTSCKKVLEDVTKDEFMMIMDLLRSLKIMKTVQSRQSLVEIVTSQAELGEPLDVSNPENVDRLVQCIKTASPLFSKNVHSKAFVEYICDHVLPNLNDIKSAEEGGNTQLDVLKIFSEISEFAGEIDKDRLEHIYNRLLAYMPLPPSEENDAIAANEQPKLEFSYVECLMFAFHQLGAKCTGFLADEENADRLKDFRLRLQYFARGVQVYIKQLRAALQGKTGDSLKTDENKIKVVALKITSNINTLIKDLFHNPPSYNATITVSWKPITPKSTSNNDLSSSTTVTAGQKRINPITFESNGAGGKKPKNPRDLYSPPTGKFSEKAGNYSTGGGGRGGYRGGRGGRKNWGRGRRW